MEEKKQIQIKADDQTAKGAYANNLVISHSKEEFILDFMNIFPPQGALLARIFTSPGHAKRIQKALEENIKNYENKFGKISESEIPQQNIGFKA